MPEGLVGIRKRSWRFKEGKGKDFAWIERSTEGESEVSDKLETKLGRTKKENLRIILDKHLKVG